jgi:hypothetical protein
MEENKFVGYEYRDITVNSKMLSMYADAYENFGWILEGTSIIMGKIGTVTLNLKRDRKVRNKAELRRLQNQFESHASEIESLEFSKTTKASAVAYVIGIIGTAFMAGSVFAVTSDMIVLTIILGLIGFIGWILPYLFYRKIKANKIAEVNPIIDTKYDEIYEICEKANKLLEN